MTSSSKPESLAVPPVEGAAGAPASRPSRWQRWLEQPWPSRLVGTCMRVFHLLVEALRIPAPDVSQLLRRIELMERNIVLPIKVAAIAMLFQSFPWIRWVSGELDITPEAASYFFWVYTAVNLVLSAPILALHRLPPAVTEWTVFFVSLIDGIFLGVLTVVTGGYNSILYWLFLGSMVRSAVSVPRGTSQLALNLTLSSCYVLAGVIDRSIARTLKQDDPRLLEVYTADDSAESLLLRLILLLLMTFGCYAVQVLLERQRRAIEEAREFAVREVQLQAAGRLAAEFAHQIKNPLAIINTAAYSLQRAMKEGKPAGAEQIQMIQEEVEHADRIITQVMGYAQLSEGHVEKLDVVDELDLAIERVFPPAAHYPIEVSRDYEDHFPPLLMQRRHVGELFINVLQNAREALEPRGGGRVEVRARCLADASVEVSIQDNGPGIPPDKLVRIFEAYYTTKQKGTGLGLATVKHTVELYGGTIRVESELGKGARFILNLPAKTLMKLAKTDFAS